MAALEDIALPELFLRRPMLFSLVAGIVVFAVLELFIVAEQDRRSQVEKSLVQARVSTVRAQLESELNASLSLSLALPTLVIGNPDFTRGQFAQVAATLVHINPSILSVALAPDNVIRYIYPEKGNESALGLDYMSTPQQRDAVLRVLREQRPVIAGPVELVQGGTGLINRVPILLPLPDGSLRNWGVASVAVDPFPIFKRVGLYPEPGKDIEFALRGRDGLGDKGEVFQGQPGIFQDPDAVLMEVVIPGGKWQLAARPSQPLQERQSRFWGYPIQLLALFLSFVSGAMVHSTLSAHRRMKTMALQDSLTGLANRHQFNLRGNNLFSLAKRSGRHLTLLNMDLNDFKLINDTRGHDVGDQVLIHVGEQLRGCFRSSDIVARVGGDEFLALLPDTSVGPKLDTLLNRIRTAIAEPVPHVDPPVQVSVCIGVATCSDTTPTLDDLMKLADDAMYQAKVKEKYGVNPG